MGKRQAIWRKNPLEEFWTKENRETACLILISVAATSFLVHGFLFSNEFFSHDSLGYGYFFDRWTVGYYVGLGRFFIPVYERIKGLVASPWTIGILYTFWISLTTFLLVNLLKIRTKLGIVFTGALLCSNLAMTLTGATYIYCMDEYAFSLFAAVAAAYMFSRNGWWNIPGLLMLVVSAGVYQAYFVTAACLCFLLVIKALIDNQKWVSAILNGLRYLALLAAGFAAYYMVWKVLCVLYETPMARTNESLLSGGFGDLFRLVLDAAVQYIHAMLLKHGVLTGLMTVVHIAVFGLLALRFLMILKDKQVQTVNKVLLAVLVLCMPIAFNAAQILFPASATRLTNFTWEMPYIMLVLSIEPLAYKAYRKQGKTIVLLLLCSVLWHHTLYANHIYLKKDLEKNATIVLAARMLERIEMLEGYVPGETKVAFVGTLPDNQYLNQTRKEYTTVNYEVGLREEYAATYSMGAYFTMYLNYPLLVEKSVDYSGVEEVQQMPAFPAVGSIQMIDGTAVVKLS